jgi:hypothetical protein
MHLGRTSPRCTTRPLRSGARSARHQRDRLRLGLQRRRALQPGVPQPVRMLAAGPACGERGANRGGVACLRVRFWRVGDRVGFGHGTDTAFSRPSRCVCKLLILLVAGARIGLWRKLRSLCRRVGRRKARLRWSQLGPERSNRSSVALRQQPTSIAAPRCARRAES